MTAILIGFVIGIPWLGALILWRTSDENPRLQHTLAVAFSIAAGCASLALIFFSSAETAVDIPMGAFFGSLNKGRDEK